MTRSSVLLALLAACACGAPPPRNLVLISVDTLRADRLGAYGYAAAETPHIDALAAESLRFDRAYAHASSTLPSIASLMTGRLPAEHHLFANVGQLRENLPTLATRLSEAGFATAGFIGSFSLQPRRGLARGFERYTQRYEDRESVRLHPENLAEPLTDAALAWLETRPSDRPFFLWMHYQEPHGPYTPPRFRPAASTDPELPQSASQSGRGAIPRYQWLGHGRLADYQVRYDGEIAEVDRNVGRLLAALREQGLLERSVLVLTADHGEAFGEDGLFCAHGEGLGEALLRVPLLLRGADVTPAVRRDAVRLIDVLPTLLAMLGLPVGELRGRTLLEDVGDRPLVAQTAHMSGRWRGLRQDGYELIEGPDSRTLRRLGDAAGEEVPEALRDELDARLVGEAPWPRLPIPAAPPDEREQLRALGYVD